jgi:hypothetical protein
MPKYGFIVVEGPHDVEFVYRLLSPFGLERVRLEEKLDPFYHKLIPRKYPPDGDLQKRMSTPLFLQNQTHVISIHSARGDSRLVETTQENATLLGSGNLEGIAIILDADADKTASAGERFEIIRSGLENIGLKLGAKPGVIELGPPRIGAYVIPDNKSTGTLEDLLLECAQQAYPALLKSASLHVTTASSDVTLTREDVVDFNLPAGKNKAIVGSIASILKPGKAIQVSVQDNRWVRDSNLGIARINAVQSFLSTILGLV